MDQHPDGSPARTLMTRRRFVALMALGAAVSVLPSPPAEAAPSMGPALQEGAPTVLPHAASVTWWGHVPLMVAVEKGFFSDVGLTVELVPIVASSDRMLAI